MNLKKLIAIILCLTVALIPAMGLTAMAAGEQVCYIELTFDGPYYTGGIMPGIQDVSLQADDAVEAAAATLREAMRTRQTYVEVSIPGHSVSERSALCNEIFDMALAHTGVPDEGDYIRTVYGGRSEGYISGASVLTLTYNINYYTTAEQEKEVDDAVDALLAQLDVDEMDDFHKVWTIYNWMCDNIVYDYENLEDDSYKLKYTPYAALINRTAVCQGYAGLLYRLLLEVGVDCRYISGKGGGGNHGWNIVKLGEKYYNADSTWDYNHCNYPYFLKCGANFPDHKRNGEYETAEFNAAYPMSDTDYDITPELPVERVELVPNTIELTVGGSKTLQANVYPENASNKLVLWGAAAGSQSIVQVENGVVTGLSEGVADIYVRSRENGDIIDWGTVIVTDGPYVPIESVSIDTEELYLTVGETAVLTATVYPENATFKDDVVWGSLQKDVATLENGVVTGLSEGTADIYVYAKGNIDIIDWCRVIVTDEPYVPIESVSIDTKELYLTVGETAVLTATVYPENATFKDDLVWVSLQEDVATLENGVVTGLSEGTADIYVYARDSDKISWGKVIVTDMPYVPIESVSLDTEELYLNVGETAVLTATVYPENATFKDDIVWGSLQEDVATLENGVVTAVSPGTADVYVYPTGMIDRPAWCTVHVSEPVSDVPIESVSLDTEELYLNVGETAVLTATVYPENATFKDDIVWGSLQEDVATVENGVVTAVSPGTADVYVHPTGQADKAARCTVHVSEPVSDVPIESVSLDTEELYLNVGETAVLTATVYPENATFKNDIVWGSLQEDVATVEKGVVTAVSPGTAVVYVHPTGQTDKVARCTVHVSEPVSEPNEYTVLSLNPGANEDGRVSVSVELAGNSDRGEAVTLVIAVYKDGALVDIKHTEVQLSKGQSDTFSELLTADEDCTFKAFVWDSLNGMKSLSNSK